MIRNYLLVAWKVLLRRKFFTFISLFGICFTLMVLMISVALLDHIFAAHPPETRLDRALGIYQVELTNAKKTRTARSALGYGLLDKYARTLEGIEDFSIYTPMTSFSLFDRGREMELYMKQTDAAFWRILDFTFVEGRAFTTEEDHNATPVAVISSAVRKELFGSASALGRTINVEGKFFRIVGVVEPVPLLRATSYADVWIPVGTMLTAAARTALTDSYNAIILARSAADFDRIKADYQSKLKQVEFPDPDGYNHISSQAETFGESVARGAAQDLFGLDDSDDPVRIVAFAGALLVLLFMLLPAVNLVNINISRIMERASEIGVRKSFGASSSTLVTQFIIENLFLVSIGGVLGLFMSWVALQWIAATELIPHAEFHLNYRIFLAAFCITVFFGLFSGVYPAWKMSRLHPIAALKGGTHS